MSRKKLTQFHLFFSIKNVFSFIFLAGILSACAYFGQKLKSPELTITHVKVEDLTLRDASLLFDFNVQNPNQVELAVDRIDYKLTLNGKSFTEGKYDQKIQVPPLGKAHLGLPVKVKYSDLMQSLQDYLQDRSMPYKLEGTAQVGVLSIPFQKTGILNLDSSSDEKK